MADPLRKSPRRLRVDPSGGGDARSLGRALALLPEPDDSPAAIYVEPGTYREKLIVDYPGLELIGAGADSCALVWGDCARAPGPDGRPMRTFASYTLLLGADGICASGISIVNDAGWGEKVGQALALYADADRLRLRDCAIRSRQDSLFLGPLPPAPIEGTDFGGPREGLPRRQGRQLYERCLIEGDVDFIFGSAAALFRGCRIVSLARPGAEGPQGYIVAPSTHKGADIGLVFDSCSMVAGPGLPDESVYAARPWRDEGRLVFDRCEMGNHVKKELWDDWGKPRAREKSFFACLDCAGTAAPESRPDWEKDITRAELDRIYAAFAAAFPAVQGS